MISAINSAMVKPSFFTSDKLSFPKVCDIITLNTTYVKEELEILFVILVLLNSLIRFLINSVFGRLFTSCVWKQSLKSASVSSYAISSRSGGSSGIPVSRPLSSSSSNGLPAPISSESLRARSLGM